MYNVIQIMKQHCKQTHTYLKKTALHICWLHKGKSAVINIGWVQDLDNIIFIVIILYATARIS